MDGEAQLAETLCDAVEELPWRKLLAHGRGGIISTQTNGAHMDGFNEQDATNLQRIKNAMAERAVGGGVLGTPDSAAATAFAAILDAETRRAELHLKSVGPEKSTGAAASWAESVTPRNASSEALAAA